MTLDERMDSTKLLIRQAEILRQGDLRLKPKLRFPVRELHMHMHPGLFSGEKVKPVGAVAKYGWTHDFLGYAHSG